MINDIVQGITDKLAAFYPEFEIYTDDIPQGFSTPSFLISLVDQDYGKRLYGNHGTAMFDIAYFSDKGTHDIKSDCRLMQENLLRQIDLIGSFRATKRNAQIVDNVLHLTFTVNYTEIESHEELLIQKHKTNIKL